MLENKFYKTVQVFSSRRGDYQLLRASPDENTLSWTPKPLGVSKRDIGVISEIEAALNDKLDTHPWWKDEPRDFIQNYTLLYKELFSLGWLYQAEDRHNIVTNKYCCLTLVQYNNGILHAYSRSTDMKNGYFSDRRVLDYLAQKINELRPDCKVEKIVWYLAVPHEYVLSGIARLKEKDTEREKSNE